MKNTLVGQRAGADLDAQVLKVLKGLDFPEPPLRLSDVRTLLELDLHYYSSTDDSALRETISRMKVAGKQILGRPSLILDAVRTALDSGARPRFLLAEPELVDRVQNDPVLAALLTES